MSELKTASSTMGPHEELLEWAQAKGVTLNGIVPKRLPGSGVGIVATRAIKADEILLDVPTSCLRSIDTVPQSIIQKLPKDISVHGLLAADLALDPAPSANYAIWNAVCPTLEDFTSMPLLWPSSLQSLLPGPAKSLLSKQQAKFTRDWTVVSTAFPDLSLENYQYAWLLVNTRTFYYLNPKLKKRSKEDRMILQPVADLFNHAEEGCNVAFDKKSFTVRTKRAYKRDEEVRICYGRHADDFLAVEYGFVMDENRWDEVGLDEVLLPQLSEKWKERLEETSFLGEYVLDRETVCHRTQVAARTLCCGVGEWKKFVEGEDDGAGSQDKVDQLLVELLEDYKQGIGKVIKTAQGLEEGQEEQKALLIQRWNHIGRLVDMTIVRLQGHESTNEVI